MQTKNTKQGGFTLVEIAIVLVIIGLLLGGILKGQELINNAESSLGRRSPKLAQSGVVRLCRPLQLHPR